MHQESMFPPCVEAMQLTITRGAYGWTLRVGARLDGERWTDVTWQQYDGLSMAELLDVIDGSATRMGP